MRAREDRKTIQRVLDGDADAFGDLVGRYAGLVHATILAEISDPHTVEDLVQESFCCAYRELPKLRDPKSLPAWLAAIARHNAYRAGQQQKARIEAELQAASTTDGSSTPLDHVAQKDEVALLWAAIRTLERDDRRLLLLRYVEDCTYREISRFLKIPRATVFFRLNRLEKALGRQLASQLGGLPAYKGRRRDLLRSGVLLAISTSLDAAPIADPTISIHSLPPAAAILTARRALIFVGASAILHTTLIFGPALSTVTGGPHPKLGDTDMRPVFSNVLLTLAGNLAMLSLASPVSAQTEWIRPLEAPILRVGETSFATEVAAYPAVLWDADCDCYHLWFNGHDGSTYRVGHGTSFDGIEWDINPDPVFQASGGNHAMHPTVVKDDGVFKMWYSTWAGAHGRRLGYATSPDGATWEDLGLVESLAPGGDWEGVQLFNSTVVHDGSGYHMWYVAGPPGAPGYGHSIGYASSSDGRVWDKHTEPVITTAQVAPWAAIELQGPEVVKDGDTFFMWYTGHLQDGVQAIGYAESENGIDWSHPLDTPVLEANQNPDAWDQYDVWGPAVVKTSAGYAMWYSGRNNLPGIGYATSLSPAPPPSIEGLESSVTAAVENGSVTRGNGRSLLAKLEAAANQSDRGNARAATNQLGAFINQVSALMASGRLPADVGAQLVDDARNVSATLASARRVFGAPGDLERTRSNTLEQNHSNPFNPSTTIEYRLSTASMARLTIYNLVGQRVRTLSDGYQPQGIHRVVWDGQDLSGQDVAGGVYLYSLEVEGHKPLSRKMILLR